MDIVIKQIDQHTHMILWKLPCKLDKQKKKKKNTTPPIFKIHIRARLGVGGVVYVRNAYTISILMYISLSF